MKSLLLVFAFAFSPQVLADDIDDFVEDMEFQPSAEGLGTMFQQGQSLTLAIDAMIWYIIHARNSAYQDGFLNGIKCVFLSRATRSDVTTKCLDNLTTASLADNFDGNARRQFHNTLSHLYDIRGESKKFAHAIDNYLADKSWGSRHARCKIYGYHNDIKQDWPSFLRAYRSDRRGTLARDYKKEMAQYFFAHVRRTYAVYTKAMNKLVPDLKKLCAAEDD